MPSITTIHRPLLAGAVLLSLLIAGCNGGDAEPTDADTLAVDTTAADEARADLVTVLREDGRFTMFAAALDSSGLGETFQGPGPFTIFAPNDVALEDMEEANSDDLLLPANRQRLRDFLMNHVINGRRLEAELQTTASVETMYGEEVDVTRDGNELTVGGARVSQADIEAGNGVIHAIDGVIWPGEPMMQQPAAEPAEPDSI